MSESLLKKTWRTEDVQRVRNLISGDYNAATKQQVGYWTIENGIRRSVSKLRAAREALKIPLACPKCGKALNTRLDKKMYPIHGMCFDCVLKMEEDLRKAGLYEEYEKNMISGNIAGFVQNLKDRIAAMTETKVEYTSDQGELEDWGMISKELIQSLDTWADLLTEKLNNKEKLG